MGKRIRDVALAIISLFRFDVTLLIDHFLNIKHHNSSKKGIAAQRIITALVTIVFFLGGFLVVFLFLGD